MLRTATEIATPVIVGVIGFLGFGGLAETISHATEVAIVVGVIGSAVSLYSAEALGRSTED